MQVLEGNGTEKLRDISCRSEQVCHVDACLCHVNTPHSIYFLSKVSGVKISIGRCFNRSSGDNTVNVTRALNRLFWNRLLQVIQNFSSLFLRYSYFTNNYTLLHFLACCLSNDLYTYLCYHLTNVIIAVAHFKIMSSLRVVTALDYVVYVCYRSDILLKT